MDTLGSNARTIETLDKSLENNCLLSLQCSLEAEEHPHRTQFIRSKPIFLCFIKNGKSSYT